MTYEGMKRYTPKRG